VARLPLVSGLRAAWGERPGVRIWATAVQVLVHHPPLIVARYEERQQLNDQETRRLSTAIFQEAPTAPNGLIWLRVHETWLSNGM
jgi:hypothetical protein